MVILSLVPVARGSMSDGIDRFARFESRAVLRLIGQAVLRIPVGLAVGGANVSNRGVRTQVSISRGNPGLPVPLGGCERL